MQTATSSPRIVRIEPPPLLDWQREVDRHKARFKVVAIGRRAGKTTFGEYAAVKCATRPHAAVWWIAPTYAQALIGWRGIKFLAMQIPNVHVSQKELVITLPTGGYVQIKSGDNPDNLRGAGLDLAILDEGAILRSDVWDAAIRPALSDKQGQALFLSTPKGHGNWFSRIYGYGLDPLHPDWMSWRLPSTVNPLMTQDELDNARSSLPDRLFRQEYLAEFIEDSGAVFRNVDKVSTGRMIARGEDGREYVGGIDWGRENDFTVVSIWDRQARAEVYIERFNKIGWQFQRARIADIYRRFNMKQIWAESNSIGAPNIEALQSEGFNVVPFNTTAQSKGPMIEALALACEKETITLINDPVATSEMKAYELDRAPSGQYRYGAPDGGHDDTVIARGIGYHAVNYAGSVELLRFR